MLSPKRTKFLFSIDIPPLQGAGGLPDRLVCCKMASSAFFRQIGLFGVIIPDSYRQYKRKMEHSCISLRRKQTEKHAAREISRVAHLDLFSVCPACGSRKNQIE